MKSLIKKILKYKSKTMYDASEAITSTDAFLWRTDNGYKTKFKFSDILDFFLKIKDSYVEIYIYSKNNDLLKIKKIENLELSNEFEITSNLLDGLNDYGVFYVYHFAHDKINANNIILNKCYVGFSQNNSLHSFVHGNMIAKYTSIKKSAIFSNYTKYFSFFKRNKYQIQNYFNDFETIELFFANQTNYKLKISMLNKNYNIQPGHCKIIKVNNQIISFSSNYYVRPIIFNYKGKYFDVYHA